MNKRYFIRAIIGLAGLFASLMNPLNLLMSCSRLNIKFAGDGKASGENRTLLAANIALTNALSSDVEVRKIQQVFLKITGPLDLSLFEIQEATIIIFSKLNRDTKINLSTIISDRFAKQVQVSLVGKYI